jgi:hypothetical protein
MSKGRITHSLLERRDFFISKCIGFGNDRNQVDFGVESAHDLHVQRLQRVTSRLDEVDTCMDAVVNDVHPVDLVLCVQVSIEALLNVFDDRTPGVLVVHEVAKSWRVNHGQAQAYAILLNVCAYRLYRHSLGHNLGRRRLALFGRIQRRVEQSVNEGGLSKARLAYWRPRISQGHSL